MKHIQKFNESIDGSVRVLYVNGSASDNDFGAIDFRKKHNGVKVADIIDNIEEYQDRDEYEITVLNFDSIDPRFVSFIKDHIQDYDQAKAQDFFLETETIKR
jgi:hypothetical protein